MDGLFTPSIDPKSYASNYNKSSSFILMHSSISCACTNNRFLYREIGIRLGKACYLWVLDNVIWSPPTTRVSRGYVVASQQGQIIVYAFLMG